MQPADETRQVGALLAVWLSFQLAAIAIEQDGPARLDRSHYRAPLHVLYHFEAGSTVGPSSPSGRAGLRYRLMKPRATGRREARPLVVFLHGAGERGQDNLRQLQTLPETLARVDFRRDRPCFVLAPQCPADSHWSDWMPQLEALILSVMNQNAVDRRRVYLTGYSMGGYGTWDLAARRPDLFAAVIPICGGGDPDTGGALATLAIWAVHGDADATVPVEESREMIHAVRDAGGDPRYSELPGVAHDCWTPTYDPASRILDWMFAQARTGPATHSPTDRQSP